MASCSTKEVQSSLAVRSILGGKYELLEEISSGRYARVFKAMDLKTGEEKAIKIATCKRPSFVKVQPVDPKDAVNSEIYGSLENEYVALKFMQGNIGFPKVFELNIDSNEGYLVMELLERPLILLCKQNNNTCNVRDALLVLDQLIVLLKSLHMAGLVHGDIKPENLLMGTRNKGKVYLIDYGLVSNHGDNGVPNLKFRSCGGTLRYMSIKAHDKLPKTPRDDLEALVYSLAYMLCFKNVPWRQEKDEKLILQMKKTITGKELFLGQPQEFATFYDAVLDLKDNQEFEYGKFKKLFRKYGKKLGIAYDFDWPFWPV